jgi:hypothetical protein
MYRVYAQRLPTEPDGTIAADGHLIRAYKPNLQPVGYAPNLPAARQFTVAPVLEAVPELHPQASEASQAKPVSATVHRLPAGRNRFLRRSLGLDKAMRARTVGNAL